MSNEIDAAKMTRAELRHFADVLAALADAGYEAISKANLTPTYRVVPGQPITMTVDYVVPVAQPALSNTGRLAEEIVAKYRAVDLPADPLPMAFPLGIPLAPAPTSYPGMVKPAADPLPAGAFVDNVPDRPEIGCPPGSASALAAASTKPAPWTEDEDDRAITAYVASIMSGCNLTEATLQTADAVSRPFSGTQFRLRNKLADRVKAALSDAATAKAPEIPAPPEPAEGPEPADGESSEGQADSAAPPVVPDDALTAHLKRLPRKDSWSLEADLELARLSVESGWGMQDIAVEFGMDAGEVKARWDALTGLHRDKTTDKLQRAFASADVLDALRRMQGA